MGNKAVLINRESLPRNLTWITVFLVGSILAIVVYGVACIGQARWPGGSSLVGLSFGVIGSLIMLFEFLLWPRKKVRAWRIGSAQVWMRAHIWLGFLTVPLIVLHSGFTLGGQLSALLMILFGIVIASGIFGLSLHPRAGRTGAGTAGHRCGFAESRNKHAIRASSRAVKARVATRAPLSLGRIDFRRMQRAGLVPREHQGGRDKTDCRHQR